MKSILILVLILQSIPHSSCAQSAGDYRSKQTGAWNLSASWETYNGSTWINAGAAPSVSNGVVTILSGHIITSSASVTIDQLVVNNGGGLTIIAGTFTLSDGASIDLSCSGTVTLSGGLLDGAGVITFNSGSTFNWTGGTNGGSGTMNINAGAVVNMDDGDVILNGTKTINSSGTWTWTSGILNYDNVSPSINNYGVFNIYTDADCMATPGTTGSFNNKAGGVINKIGSPDDETSFTGNISFTNEGTINLNSSKLKLRNGCVNTGTINVSFGADMDFFSGTATFNTTTVLAGTGIVEFAGGTVLINNADLSAVNLTISGATVTLVPNLGFTTGYVLSLSAGALTASGNVSFNSGSSFNWSGGTIGGTGITTVNAGATITMDGSSHYITDTKTVNNYGTWTWTEGTFYYDSGTPVINNYGVFNINTDEEITPLNTNNGSFNNKAGGIINKTGSPFDETTVGDFGDFTNAGTINVNSSMLKLFTGSLNTGTINISFGANMNFHGTTSVFNTGTTLAGTGTLNFDAGSATINDGSVVPANINVNAGVVTFVNDLALNNGQLLKLSGGELTGSGAINFNTGSSFTWLGGINSGTSPTNINAGANFIMDVGVHSLAGTKILNNYTTWSWNNGPIYLINGDPVVNNYGTLNINTDDDIIQFNTNADAFNNMSTGTINKEGSAEDKTAVNDITSFNNAGAIHVFSGNLEINVAGSHSGTYNIDFGGQLNGSLLMSYTGNSFTNNGTVGLAELIFNGSGIQSLDGEGFIEMLQIDNSTGVNLTEKQTINTGGFSILPASKFKVYGYLLLL